MRLGSYVHKTLVLDFGSGVPPISFFKEVFIVLFVMAASREQGTGRLIWGKHILGRDLSEVRLPVFGMLISATGCLRVGAVAAGGLIELEAGTFFSNAYQEWLGTRSW